MATAKSFARNPIVVAVLLGISVFLVGLHRLPVPTVDGAVRASESRYIARTGELWPVHYQGEIITDHPPMYLWAGALSFKIFGVNDFAANLMPRIFAALAVILTALIALELRFTIGATIASVLILCLTRDFVLSSVRGYIEPFLETFTYAAFWLALRQERTKNLWPSFFAGVSIFAAAFSKGPVALWPLLFIAIVFLIRSKHSRRINFLLAYSLGFLTCVLLFCTWATVKQHWSYWNSYLFGQVLSSAMQGRGGAQTFEPFYFFKILLQYYWPWLPLLALSYTAALIEKDQTRKLLALLGLGFFGGFSIMKWKFWYYIAPAYPAFALLIAATLEKSKIIPRTIRNLLPLLQKHRTLNTICIACLSWIIIGNIVPIPLHHERIPEVLAFRPTILARDTTTPIWFVHNPTDHNMVGTSGEWYYDREVKKVNDEQASTWATQSLKSPAWIIVGEEYFSQCKEDWCTRAKLILSAGKSSLVLY